MNTTENNKIIAEFMGGIMITNHPDCKQISFLRNNNAISPTKKGYYTLSMLKYDTSWNWLIEVLSKIENIRHSKDVNSMRFDFYLKQHSAWINDYETEGKKFIYCGGYHSKLLACYDAVIYFIKWYNKQNT